MSTTLLLNATYEPLTIITWRKAVRLMLLGKAEALESYEDNVRSTTSALPMPAVLRLRQRVTFRRKTIRFCRQNVYMRDRYTCQYCLERKSRNDLTFDHVVPRTRGGRTSWQNIVACCFDCNQRKADRTPEEAGMTLTRPPYAPMWLPVEAEAERLGIADRLWSPYLWQ